MVSRKHGSDVEVVLARRHDNGADFWATADGRLAVGEPFSTLTSLLVLHELKVSRTHEAVSGALRLVREAQRDDGRFPSLREERSILRTVAGFVPVRED